MCQQAEPFFMKQFFTSLALCLATIAGLAQCTGALNLNATLAASASAEADVYMSIELQTVTVDLDWSANGFGPYPSDVLMYVYAPDGSCAVWGGWNVDADAACTDLGTDLGGLWPDDWNSGTAGTYTATIDVSAAGLAGTGDWTVVIVNAYTTSSGANYEFSLTFDGPCAGDCPDPTACNYVAEEDQVNPLEEVCLYPEDLFGVGYDCDGVCLGDEDGDGICDEADDCFGSLDECGVCEGTGTIGCTDDMACNYDAEADCDDGGCQYLDACGDCGGNGVSGCIDPQSCNFNENATCDDGSCTVNDECGVCGGDGYLGCNDAEACNYDVGASCDDGSCIYLDALGECGGICLADEDEDGLCDACEQGDYYLDIATVMDHTEGDLAGMTTYQVSLVCANPEDYLYSISGNASIPMSILSTSGSWFNNDLNTSWNASGLDAALVEENPTLAYDSYLTIGASESGQLHPNSVPWTAPDPRDEFEPGVGLNIEASGTGTFYTLDLSNDDNHPAYAGDDSQVLVLQLTTEGDIYGTMSCLIWPGGNTGNQFALTLDFDSNSLCNNLDPCVGETDECGVCTGPGAIYACGCTEIPEGDCDCQGNQLDALGGCGGDCLADENGNGVCDNSEVYGCTYELAENYASEATYDDGSCIFPCEGVVNTNVFDWDGDYVVTVTDFLMMLSVYGDTDVDLDGVWDSGDDCVDTNACNYANDPSEPCAYIDVLGVCGGGCEGDEDNDGICDDIDTCIGVEDECGVCNGPGPTEVVIDDILITYDSVFLPVDGEWFVYAVDVDTTYTYTCAPFFGACGDPVSYQGYDYETVQIGNQCWFAENLRNENYENGDAIPANLGDFEWQNTTAGAVAVYGEDDGCSNYSPDIDACDPAQSLEEYGRLYNWYAVDDARGLCPSGWHVPTDVEWTVMTDELGGESIAGGQMKTTYGWFDGGHGTNSSGFSGLPGGLRYNYGDFDFAVRSAAWWSSSPSPSDPWFRELSHMSNNVFRFDTNPRFGFSVRCVRDAE